MQDRLSYKEHWQMTPTVKHPSQSEISTIPKADLIANPRHININPNNLWLTIFTYSSQMAVRGLTKRKTSIQARALPSTTTGRRPVHNSSSFGPCVVVMNGRYIIRHIGKVLGKRICATTEMFAYHFGLRACGFNALGRMFRKSLVRGWARGG